jgi:hypothetical protein
MVLPTLAANQIEVSEPVLAIRQFDAGQVPP